MCPNILPQPASPDDCARQLLEVVPPVMRVIRAEMRSLAAPELSVPQFRVLSYLNWHAGASLSAVADHIGLTRPAMSVPVDGLVHRKLVTRQTDPDDRRRLTLTLTRQGENLYAAARQHTQARLAGRLAALSPTEREALAASLEQLRGLFIPQDEPASQAKELS
jgi:DNA-binding MarR family transcriptional regulator